MRSWAGVLINDRHRGSHMSEVTHYLYRIQPSRLEMLTQGPTPAEAEIISRHFAYLQQLTEQGAGDLGSRRLARPFDRRARKVGSAGGNSE